MTFDTDEHVNGALTAGARGFLLKGAAPDQLVHALHTEVGQELYISLSTVKFHLGGLTATLGARNRVELAIWASETGRVP